MSEGKVDRAKTLTMAAMEGSNKQAQSVHCVILARFEFCSGPKKKKGVHAVCTTSSDYLAASSEGGHGFHQFLVGTIKSIPPPLGGLLLLAI